MATTVEIGVYLTTGDAPYFRLNDPVKGKLNNTSYRLAGPIFYDITDKVTGVSVQRGKNRQLERYNAGRATIILNNEDRSFDPLNTDSIFYGNIIPRRQIRVRSGGYNQFVGLVEDWNFNYDVSGKSTAEIAAADGFTLLAQQSLTAGTATAQTTGERVNAVLSMPSVAWPLTQREIDTGSSQVGADVWTVDDNALTYLQEVEASEQGQLFISRDGYIKFVDGAVTPTSGDRSVVATNLVTNPSMEASSGTVTVRTNLVTNPSFETNTTGWSAGGGTISRVTTENYVGTASLQAVTSAQFEGPFTGSLSVSASQTYVYSAWLKGEVGKSYRLQLREVTSGGTTVGTTSGTSVVASGGWQRLTVSRAFGSTGVNAVLIVNNMTTGAHTFYVDAVQLEAGSTASAYFDGSTSAAGDFTYAWSGTAHASTSLMRGVGVASSTQGVSAASIQSTNWASSGTKSIRIIPTTTGNNSWVRFDIPTTVGEIYTVMGKLRQTQALAGSQWPNGRRINAYNSAITTVVGQSAQSTNAAGIYSHSVTFVAASTTTPILLGNGASAGNGDVWWDDLIVVAGTYTGDYFDGNTTDYIPYSYRWTGTENASTSVKEISSLPLFSDEGDGIPYVSASVSYGSELLYNQVTVSSPFGGTAVANNTDSQNIYGITTTDVSTLLSTSNAVQSLSEFWVAKYGDPEYRFESVDVALDGLSGAQKEQVLQFELGDIVQMKFTPNKVGDAIQRYGQIIGIKHNIGADRHTITFGLGSLQYAFLVLDDTGFGILDENALAF